MYVRVYETTMVVQQHNYALLFFLFFCITVAFKVCATELYSCLPQFSLRHVAGGAQHTFGLKRAFLLEKGQLAGLKRILMLV